MNKRGYLLKVSCSEDPAYRTYASVLQRALPRLLDSFRIMAGELATRIGLPGIVQPVDFYDDVTGKRLRVHIGPLFTVISVGNRDYYFRRVSGAFDGTGWTMVDACHPTHALQSEINSATKGDLWIRRREPNS